MSERAHPDDPAFDHKGWRLTWRRRFIPWLSPPHRNPYRDAFEWRYRWVAPYCQNKVVLDVPCGMGWGTSLIQGTKSLTGVDIDTASIAEANQRYSDSAQFKVGSMAELPFFDDSVDVVVCLEGIEHVPVDIGDQFLHEASRVLISQGKLLLSSPYCTRGGHSGNPYHIHEYQPDEIRTKVGQLFRIESETAREVGPMTVLYLECSPLA